jgi:hypothetical protein
MNETRYPLCWPANWKRTTNRTRAQFGKAKPYTDRSGEQIYMGKGRLSMHDAIQRIAYELERFGVPEENVIISSNVPLNLSGVPRGDRGEPSDPGVAVYWTLKGKSQCMAIDRYERVADNLAAVAATMEALRAIERHGGGSILERAFIGFAQLPAQAGKPWRQILKFEEQERPSVDSIEQRYRALAHNNHPDKPGGAHEAMLELNAARVAALAEVNAA